MLRARHQPSASNGDKKLCAKQKAALVKWDQFHDYTVLESQASPAGLNSTPLIIILKDACYRKSHPSAKFSCLTIFGTTGAGSEPQQLSAETEEKQIHITIRLADRDSAGNSIAWGTVPWKDPLVMRKGQ